MVRTRAGVRLAAVSLPARRWGAMVRVTWTEPAELTPEAASAAQPVDSASAACQTTHAWLHERLRRWKAGETPA